MDRVVIDSSVFIKLYIDEDYSGNAYRLREAYLSGDMSIIVPSILAYEVLNALRYSGDYNEQELERISQDIREYGFDVFDMLTELAKNTVRMAKRYNITIYDASYVALAFMTNSSFYTADEELIEKTKLPFVKHIREF